MFDDTLKLLDLGVVSESVRTVLGRSSRCLEHGDLKNALVHAQSARALAGQFNDALGVAASLLHAGAALSEMGRLEDAGMVLFESFQNFHREPAWEQRLNEAIALIELGKVAERAAAQRLINGIASYQKAEPLLKEALSQYALAGDDIDAPALESLREYAIERVNSLVQHLTSITETNAPDRLDARPENGEYVVDLRPSSFILRQPAGLATDLDTHIPSEELQPAGAEEDVADATVFRAADQSELQAFDRDDHGSVQMRE